MSACMSMQTRRGLVAEQVQNHPELSSLTAQLQVVQSRLDALESLSTKLDALFIKLNVMEEAHRDDTGMLLSEVKKMIDDASSEVRNEIKTVPVTKPGKK